MSAAPSTDSMESRAPAGPGAITVVLPVYNVARYIEGCIDSIAAQTLRPYEVVVVDDCGSDDSVALATTALARHGLTHRVVRHAANRGLGAARNTGAAAARGQFVWFLDCDDRAEPQFLSSLVAAITTADADLAISRTLLVDPADEPIAIDEPRWADSVIDGRAAARALLANAIRAYAGNKLFRRALLPAGMFDEGRAYEDFRPVLVHVLACRRIALVDEPLLRYTQHANSISGGFGAHTADLFAVAADVGDVLAKDDPLGWNGAYLEYLYLNAVLPVANLALRAEHSGRAGDGTRDAVRMSRRAIAPAHIARLAYRRRYRLAASAAVLKASPRFYSRVLARR